MVKLTQPVGKSSLDSLNYDLGSRGVQWQYFKIQTDAGTDAGKKSECVAQDDPGHLNFDLDETRHCCSLGRSKTFCFI
jgi:hypothetical protein